MIKWCAYCQRFLGEHAPFDNYIPSHGICKPCSAFAMDLPADSEKKMYELVRIQRELWALGKTKDFPAVVKLVEDVVHFGVRPVDILLGFIIPMLVQCSEIPATSFASDGMREFCLKLIEVTREKLYSHSKNQRIDVLFATLPANEHVLGIQLLELWLCAEGIAARATHLSEDELVALCTDQRPKVVGFSIADKNHVSEIKNAITRIRSASPIPPLFLLGGYAVKNETLNLELIPEACPVMDSEKMLLTIKTHLSLGFLYDLKEKKGA